MIRLKFAGIVVFLCYTLSVPLLWAYIVSNNIDPRYLLYAMGEFLLLAIVTIQISDRSEKSRTIKKNLEMAVDIPIS